MLSWKLPLHYCSISAKSENNSIAFWAPKHISFSHILFSFPHSISQRCYSTLMKAWCWKFFRIIVVIRKVKRSIVNKCNVKNRKVSSSWKTKQERRKLNKTQSKIASIVSFFFYTLLKLRKKEDTAWYMCAFSWVIYIT